MNIDPALIAMLLKTGLLNQQKAPGLLAVSGKPPVVQDPNNTTKIRTPIQTIGVRG